MLLRLTIISITALFLNVSIIWADSSEPKYHYVSNPESLKAKEQEVKTISIKDEEKITEKESKATATEPATKSPKHNKYYRVAKEE